MFLLKLKFTLNKNNYANSKKKTIRRGACKCENNLVCVNKGLCSLYKNTMKEKIMKQINFFS